MKAVRYHSYGDSDVLVYEEADRPVAGAGQVVVRVAGTSFNPVDVLAHDRYTVVELVPEHHQRAVEAVCNVDLLHRRAVHLGVGPDGGDELGDAPRRRLHLSQQ